MTQVRLQKCPHCDLNIREDFMQKHQMRVHKDKLKAKGAAAGGAKKKVALKEEDLEEIVKDMTRHSVFDTDDPLVLASRDLDEDAEESEEAWEEGEEGEEGGEGEEGREFEEIESEEELGKH